MTHVFKWYSIWLKSVDFGATMVKGNVLYPLASFSRSRASDFEKHPFMSDRIPLFHFTTCWALLWRHCSKEVSRQSQVQMPLKPWIFFRFLSNCLNWKINCDGHSSLSSTTAVQIWITSHMLHIKVVPLMAYWAKDTKVVFPLSLISSDWVAEVPVVIENLM